MNAGGVTHGGEVNIPAATGVETGGGVSFGCVSIWLLVRKALMKLYLCSVGGIKRCS